MSTSWPHAPAPRPLPQPPTATTSSHGDAFASPHITRQHSFGAESYDSFKDDLEQGGAQAYPMRHMGSQEPRSAFTSQSRDGDGVSIMGFDANVQSYMGLGAPSSFRSEQTFRPEQPRPYSDPTRSSLPPYAEFVAPERAPEIASERAPERAGPAAPVYAKKPSNRRRWTLCGLGTAVVVGAAVGLGVYFGQVKPSQEASSAGNGNAAGASTTGASSSSTSARSAVGSSSSSSLLSTGGFSSISSSTRASSSSSSSPAVVSSSTSFVPSQISTTTTSSAPAAISTPAGGSTSAGILPNGMYSLVLTKATDNCQSQNLICPDQMRDTWTMGSSNGAYTVSSSTIGSTINVGAPSADNYLLFDLANTTNVEGNDCTYSVRHGYGIYLKADGFSGSSIWRRTLAQACDSTSGSSLDVGSLCDCQYTLEAN